VVDNGRNGGEAGGGAGRGHGPALAADRPRVLLVEDDPDQAGALSELLSERFEVLWERSGEEALAAARAELPDLVLLDRHLTTPLDGVGVFEALQRDGRTADLPVVFLSGERDESTVVRVLELGAADYVRKPASPRELLARLERVLQQSRQQRALEALAQTDGLTGLANFRALMARLEEELKRARRYRHPLALVMLDLDRLKQINDRWGHDAGNRAIVAVAGHLRANLREVDFAARFGGDEFTVLLPHQTASEATVFAERVLGGLREVRVAAGGPGGPPLELSVSIGVAEQAEGGPFLTAEGLLKAADAALYRAKQGGRDGLAVHEDGGPLRH
jgi:diguanylate cyclase (GGDEF)-like protein